MLNALKHSSITVKQNDTLSAAGTRRESLRDYSLLEKSRLSPAAFHNYGFLHATNIDSVII